jgi:hypothetical protein
VIGINRVGYSLMEESPEISGRVQILSFGKRQPPNRIFSFISKGELRANIGFIYIYILQYIYSKGTFIAQQICYHLAVYSDVLETRDELTEIPFPLV